MTLAENEVGAAKLGDQRLTKRLVNIVDDLAKNSETSLPNACGSWSRTKAIYRFFDNNKVDPSEIRHAHRQTTLKRIENEEIILAVQDTTSFNFTKHKSTEGVGPIGSNATSTSTGFFMHSTMAVSTNGVPLGIIAQKIWSRPEEPKYPPKAHKKRPIKEKESFRWLTSLKDSVDEVPSSTRVIMVGDRESDIYDLFVEAASLGQDLLIRAAWNRRLENKEGYSLDAVKEAPILGEITVTIPRTKNEKEREITLELQAVRVCILPPKSRKKDNLPNITLTVIRAKEKNPPDGKKAIEWFLLTTLSVDTAEEAALYVKWYSYRWLIERYHYVLKSGCTIEELQLKKQERLERAVAVYSVVAWMILWMIYGSRLQPDSDCSYVLSEDEWQILYIVINKDMPPSKPPSLHEAVKWLARLGGFLGRKNDRSPGVKVLWRGLRQLRVMVLTKMSLQEAQCIVL